MQTNFTQQQLEDPRLAEVNGILRTCVHCGFCTATCPTYVLLGDELDSPRGRIYLIKNMMEKGQPATAETVKHIDRCLSCLSCMTTCPSGVHYMHLVDDARMHIEKSYKRPRFERFVRDILAYVMPRPKLFRLALVAARLGKPFRRIFSALQLKQIEAIFSLMPNVQFGPEVIGQPGTYPAEGKKRGRVALLMGCVQSVLDPEINAAAIRLLTRLGFEVVVAGEESCCGSLTHHMGKEPDAHARARRSIDQWTKANVDAVIITASGCGTTVKDYGYMLRHDPTYADAARTISAKSRDVTEFLSDIELGPVRGRRLRVAYHSACSMQHGQKIKTLPQKLLREAGYEVVEVPEGHLCCGSAGTYNILQPEIARKLRERKIGHIKSTTPDIIATGNIGCMAQIGSGTNIPILHTVQLLDWAYGGPEPHAVMKAQSGSHESR